MIACNTQSRRCWGAAGLRPASRIWTPLHQGWSSSRTQAVQPDRALRCLQRPQCLSAQQHRARCLRSEHAVLHCSSVGCPGQVQANFLCGLSTAHTTPPMQCQATIGRRECTRRFRLRMRRREWDCGNAKSVVALGQQQGARVDKQRCQPSASIW